jgi:cephalosporin hydroxylase
MTPDEIASVACHEHRASQKQDELAAAVELVAAADPKTLLEIGCDRGGTLWAWGQVCPEVYGITLADNSYSTGGSGQPLNTHTAMVYVGDSHDPTTLAWLTGQLYGRPLDVLVLDGDHLYPGIQADWELYGRLVRPGGLILLHDIYSAGDLRCEVWKFWPGKVKALPPDWVSEIRSAEATAYGWGVVTVGGGP